MEKKFLECIYRITREVANVDEVKISSIDESTILFGEGSAIDSLDLVNILIGIEEFIEKTYGVSVELIDEDAIISPDSPFSNPLTLSKYIGTKINGK